MAKNREFAKANEIALAVPEGTKSGDPLILGSGLPAVALQDRQSNGKATLQFDGAYRLSVEGKNKAGNKAIEAGDILFMKGGKLGVNNEEGVRFGYALDAVESGKTATIRVKIGY